jgi:hypothetical protein
MTSFVGGNREEVAIRRLIPLLLQPVSRIATSSFMTLNRNVILSEAKDLQFPITNFLKNPFTSNQQYHSKR